MRNSTYKEGKYYLSPFEREMFRFLKEGNGISGLTLFSLIVSDGQILWVRPKVEIK